MTDLRTFERFKRTLVWETADRRMLRHDEISDEHLKNIIRHCKHLASAYGELLIYRFCELAEERDIDPDTCVPPTIPFRDETGRLKTYSYQWGCYVYLE